MGTTTCNSNIKETLEFTRIIPYLYHAICLCKNMQNLQLWNEYGIDSSSHVCMQCSTVLCFFFNMFNLFDFWIFWYEIRFKFDFIVSMFLLSGWQQETQTFCSNEMNNTICTCNRTDTLLTNNAMGPIKWDFSLDPV